jgi:hypothetical protein
MLNTAKRNLSQGLRERASTRVTMSGTSLFSVREHVGGRIHLAEFRVMQNLLDRIRAAALFEPPRQQKKKMMQVVRAVFVCEPVDGRTDFVQ